MVMILQSLLLYNGNNFLASANFAVVFRKRIIRYINV
jgi:hypothetical protein